MAQGISAKDVRVAIPNAKLNVSEGSRKPDDVFHGGRAYSSSSSSSPFASSFTLYSLQLKVSTASGQLELVVWRRYSEFQALAHELHQGKHAKITLPPKQLLASSEASVRQRRVELESSLVKYLQGLDGELPSPLVRFFNLEPLAELVPPAISSATAKDEIIIRESPEEQGDVDFSQRPEPEDGGATPVSINYFVISIQNVSGAEGTFDMDFYLDLIWEDTRLAGQSEGDVDWDSVWKPDIDVANANETSEPLFENFLLSPEGEVTYQTRYRTTLQCNMRLHRFPYDIQCLGIQFESGAHVNEELVWRKWAHSGVNLSRELRHGECVPEWDIQGVFDRCIVNTLEFDGSKYSQFQIKVVASRRASYYLLKICVPFFLIVLMSLSSFTMEPTEVSDRVGTSIEAALTATAFQLLCAEALPKIPYLTEMDKFLYVSFFVIFLGCVESVFVYKLTKDEELVPLAVAIDAWALRISISFCFCSFGWFLRGHFDRSSADKNKDGIIDQEEAEAWHEASSKMITSSMQEKIENDKEKVE